MFDVTKNVKLFESKFMLILVKDSQGGRVVNVLLQQCNGILPHAEIDPTHFISLNRNNF